MESNPAVAVVIFNILMLSTQTMSVYLPEVSKNTRLLDTDTIEKHGQYNMRVRDVRDANERRQQKSYDKNNDVVVLEELEENIERDNYIGGSNAARTSNSDTYSYARNKRELSDILIAPHTRWCGRGNLANGTYNHLGGSSAADKCCRKHDHCELFIPAMSNRYELFNYRPYTVSHCSCDRRFRTCLKMANDEDANTIGKLFFNMVQTNCFIVRNEKVCEKRTADGSCEREHVRKKAYLKLNKKF